MFFIKELRQDIILEPRYMGRDMLLYVRRKLNSELQGQCLGKHGYVISILEVRDENIEPGLIDIDNGSVHVTVKYKVILLRPFRNEVVDAVVSFVQDYGFDAKVGPLRIYVSKHNIPDDVQYNTLSNDSWISDDGSVDIRADSLVRVRILGVTIDGGGMVAIGSIAEPCLGQLD